MSRVARRARDAGESLIEVIISIFILGTAAVAITESMLVSTKLSDIHRKEANAASDVRDYAEAIQSYVAGTASHYQACAAANSYTPALVGYTVPSGYTASQSAALAWNNTSWGACSTDPGFQRVTIKISSTDNRANEKLDVVLRRPCRPSDTLCS
jgi:type II secretory pathway pseudopilin PulG